MWGIIARFVLALVGPLLAKILGGLGIAAIAYSGSTVVLDYVEDYVMATFTGLSVDLLNIVYLVGLDEGIKILFAAYAVKLTIQLTMGVFKRLSFGGA